ncbi:hypothetical protein [Luteimonas aquatica]|uniref:hypothetical protein n=1 Tax=Luteimonas aquatica TaxID=450364 RepID=UPI001F5A9090|nr:hypothetical protein [Luteimonas aquatica]
MPRPRAADAYVAALVSADPAWQAVLPAMALGLALPAHEAEPMGPRNPVCRICFHDAHPSDRTLAAYFRHKEGSGWSDEAGPTAAMLTLEEADALAAGEWPRPTPRDVWVLHTLLDLLRALPAGARYGQARTRIKASGLLAVNTPQRCQSLLESLAFLGVLANADFPGLLQRFTTAAERDRRPSPRIEAPAPLAWWTGGDGVDEALLARLFGHLARPAREPAAPARAAPARRKAPAAAGAKKGPAPLPGPVAAGDVYAVRVREDAWVAAYCHQTRTDHKGAVWGCMEYLDLCGPQPPDAAAAARAGYRDRRGGDRWQSWCRGLDKTAGVKRIATGIAAPAHRQPAPTRIPSGSAADLKHLASWHFALD